MTDSLIVYAAAGVELRLGAVARARRRLAALGFDVSIDPSVRARHQRFAGDDDARLATLHRVADAAPSVAMASRGGYGLTRLLDRINWGRIARSVEQGTRSGRIQRPHRTATGPAGAYRCAQLGTVRWRLKTSGATTPRAASTK